MAGLAGAVLALAGCSSIGLGGGSTPAELALACPKVSIIGGLHEVTEFRPGGRDMTDVASRAALTDYSGNCEYDSRGVTVNVKVDLLAERGPAMQGNSAAYRYFVAVMAPGHEDPVQKAVYDVSVTFPANAARAAGTDEVAVTIPVGKDVNAKDWQVVLGFQLTPEQLAFNRTVFNR
ncbi:hypothetical protein [Azospirillum halopraeferens]|uniref:hypothetical protein n=1 Tax=Azospirillum halopraeferens TaxID=34010 RepID=UPI001FE189AE|nr:hypothetical protein [Azospirillum halopraeferens]